MTRILDQFRAHSVSLFSLAVAISALLYTSWRYEETEYNWNVRVAGFEMLVTLGELQRVVYLNHYDRDLEAGNPRHGWVQVMVLRAWARSCPSRCRQKQSDCLPYGTSTGWGSAGKIPPWRRSTTPSTNPATWCWKYCGRCADRQALFRQGFSAPPARPAGL